MKFDLGDLCRDRVTGFEGIVVAITCWLNGCIRVTLQPRKLKENGEHPETVTFDQHQVELVSAGVVEPFLGMLSLVNDDPTYSPQQAIRQSTGGPSIAPVQRRDVG